MDCMDLDLKYTITFAVDSLCKSRVEFDLARSQVELAQFFAGRAADRAQSLPPRMAMLSLLLSNI